MTAVVDGRSHERLVGSADRSAAPAVGTVAPVERGRTPGRSRHAWRRYRLPALAALALVLLVLLVGLARTRSVRGELDPSAVDGPGSRALAVLLGDRGVEVRRLTRLDEATSAVGAREAIVVPFPDLLPPDALRTVGDLTQGRIVLVAPGQAELAAVTATVRPAGTADIAIREPGCDAEPAVAAGAVELGGTTYSVDDGSGCYPAGDAVTLALSRTRGGAELVVLGSGTPLRNERLDDEGDAALALNLLGADGSADAVRWLVPSPGSAAGEGGASLSDITPAWARAAALQLLLAALLAALWRARRLGPPVTEPLPVVVRAAEAVEGRARLYRRAQARDRAADALRSGARTRLSPRLGLGVVGGGGEVDPAALVDAVASRSGRRDTEVRDALYGPPPADDAGLVRLADTLDTMVRSTLDPEVRRP